MKLCIEIYNTLKYSNKFSYLRKYMGILLDFKFERWYNVVNTILKITKSKYMYYPVENGEGRIDYDCMP